MSASHVVTKHLTKVPNFEVLILICQNINHLNIKILLQNPQNILSAIDIHTHWHCSFHCHVLITVLTHILDVVENLKAELIPFLFVWVEFILKREELNLNVFILVFFQQHNVYVAYSPDHSLSFVPCFVKEKFDILNIKYDFGWQPRLLIRYESHYHQYK